MGVCDRRGRRLNRRLQLNVLRGEESRRLVLGKGGGDTRQAAISIVFGNLWMCTMYTHIYAYFSTDLQAAAMLSLTHAPPWATCSRAGGGRCRKLIDVSFITS